ncbi:hypothetical protein CEP54_016174 [Fusarium duplospermum]|uniref:Uncharacterized protein n=1 Tax=Fusarium duplospermum TaxID=1325734 RepID=A0A428NHC2_9HYPO|nr:hypothetical protein CEP54_016174 [Fusarium duplospermum]
MDVPSITFSTEDKTCFTYQDGYDGVATRELQELLRLGQEMLVSIKAELARRKISVLETLPTAVKTCVEKLQASMTTLKILQRLDDPANLASSAAETLKNERTDRRERIYKKFLQDLREQCGGGTVVLCSSSLGKRRIVELKNMERISLLGYLKSNRNNFEDTILDDLAVTLGITYPMHRSMSEPHEPAHDLDTTRSTAQPASIERQIEYKYSEADVDAIPLLGPDLASALQASKQWMWERQTGGLMTDCISGLSPRNRGDITLQLLLGFREGTEIMERLRMQAI